MADPDTLSPRARFLHHCARGELAFQRSAGGEPLFYPRLVDPETGGVPRWDISAGLGEVHAVTVVHQKDEPPHALALIRLDEGFRMMSRVETGTPDGVAIGDRVRVVFRPLGDGPALPVFIPAGERA